MDLQDRRELVLLSELDRDGSATQRALASKLGVALGLTNLCLKRLSRKGYITITATPRSRSRYVLTQEGLAEKSRLTAQYIRYSLLHYRDMRARMNEMLSALDGTRGQRVAIYGTNELAELVYLSLREMQVDCVGFIDGNSRTSFLSCPVSPLDQIDAGQFDHVLIADLDHAAGEAQLMQSGVPREKMMRLVLHP